MSTRVRRMSYMQPRMAVVAKGAKSVPAQAEAYQNLLTLMAHPRGVQSSTHLRSHRKPVEFHERSESDTFTAIVQIAE